MQTTTATVCFWRGLIHPWGFHVHPALWFLHFYSLLSNESRNSSHFSNMQLLFASFLSHVSILQICVSLDFSVCTLDGLIRPAEIIIIINPHYKSKQCSIAPILFSFNPVHVIRHWWPAAEPNSCCHQLAINYLCPTLLSALLSASPQYGLAAHESWKFYLKLWLPICVSCNQWLITVQPAQPVVWTARCNWIIWLGRLQFV